MKQSALQLGDGQTLPLTQSGSGKKSVVLIHGWACNRQHWQALLDQPLTGVSLLAVDLPGHGDAATLALPNWTVTAQAQALAEALGDVVMPVVVGHSMGGAVALELARLMPLKAVILVDTFALPYGDLDEQTAQRIETPFYQDFDAAVSNLVTNNAGPDLPDKQKQTLADDMTNSCQQAMLPLWSDLLRWSPAAAFAEIDCPVHAINGDLVGEVARARCAGKVTEWRQPSTWHFPQMEQPTKFSNKLAQVLTAIGL